MQTATLPAPWPSVFGVNAAKGLSAESAAGASAAATGAGVCRNDCGVSKGDDSTVAVASAGSDAFGRAKAKFASGGPCGFAFEDELIFVLWSFGLRGCGGHLLVADPAEHAQQTGDQHGAAALDPGSFARGLPGVEPLLRIEMRSRRQCVGNGAAAAPAVASPPGGGPQLRRS